MNIGIIVINLLRATNRKEKMQEQLRNVNIPAFFFDGFDGADINNISIGGELFVNVTHLRKFLIGEIATIFSHVGALKMGKSIGLDYVIILEDDAILTENFEAKVRRLLESCKNDDWDIFYLGGSLENDVNISDELMVYDTNGMNCIQSYIIKKESIDKICKILMDLKLPADTLLMQALENEKIRGRLVLPFFTYQGDTYSYISNDYKSLVNKTKKYFK